MKHHSEGAHNLNTKQREAVQHVKGPLLIVAGAGTGKTNTLTHRIAHLIATGIAPERILAVTFTNKAAQEMKERVRGLLKEQQETQQGKDTQPDEDGFLPRQTEPFVSTFHALGVHILRGSGSHIGIERHFTILDKAGSLSSR